MTSAKAAVRRRIERCARPLLCSHVRLDGDALGTELGLASILRALGKTPHTINDGLVPECFRFLPSVDKVGTSTAALRDDYDLVIVLDAGSWARLGQVAERVRGFPAVVIDHHPDEAAAPAEACGEARWTDPARGSTGEMVYDLAVESGWPIPPEAATALYTAIVSDTGRFAFGNVTPSALRAAAALLELGADHEAVMRHLYVNEPLGEVRLRGEIMSNLRLYEEGAIAVARVTQAMLRRHGVSPVDPQELAQIPRAVAGVKVGCLLRELEDGRVKVSLRSVAGVDVGAVAQAFGGGGHAAAAGCEVPGTLDDVESRLVKSIRQALAPAAPRPRSRGKRAP